MTEKKYGGNRKGTTYFDFENQCDKKKSSTKVELAIESVNLGN